MEWCLWRKAYHSPEGQSLITLTAFHVEALQYILARFDPVYDQHTPRVDEDGIIVCKIS